MTLRKTNGETAWPWLFPWVIAQSASLIISPVISGLHVDGCTILTSHQHIPRQAPFPSACRTTQMEGLWSQMVQLEALSWAPLTVAITISHALRHSAVTTPVSQKARMCMR